MAVFKCKMCGGDLNVVDKVTICECEYCGTKQTIPKNNDENIANLFNRANRLRIHCEFDKAIEIYEKIINLDDTEAEAHWGMVLCKYGIEYVEDPVTFERVPTCHLASYEAVTEDNDYISAIANADEKSKALYETEAKRIEEIQQRILVKVKNEKPFDVFICYKETADNGDRTEDSVLAQNVYDALTEKGLKVFFARITLEDKLGQEYEPYIFSALNSAKVMLVVSTKSEYANAVWVRNEWSRFLKLLKKDSSKMLIPCYKDMDPYDLPEAFAHLQAQNMAKVGAIQDLVRGVCKVVQSNGDVDAKAFSMNTSVLDDAFSLLEDGSFALAERYCDNVLKNDPENAKAYLGKLMVDLQIKHFNAKEFTRKKYKKNENYLKVMEYGDEFIKEKFHSFDVYAAKHTKKKAITIGLAAALLIVVAISSFFIVRKTIYDNYVEEFYSGGANYTLLEKKFSDFGSYASSEMYARICGAKTGKVYPEATELEYSQVTNFSIQQHFPNVTNITVSGSTQIIPAEAFKDLKSLENVNILVGVTAISNSAFSGCTSLVNVNISNSVIEIGSDAFSDCVSLKNVVLPEYVTSIGDRAFNRCVSLRSINIPRVVSYIGSGAFSYSAIKNIVIPKSVENIGNYAFGYCFSLENIYCESASRPNGWSVNFSTANTGQVIWGYKQQ